jgi:hypothetical protein
MAKAEQRSPFAPAPLQGLRRYYGRLRPCASLRYSRPRGWTACGLSLHVLRRDEAQILTFHTKAWSSFAPPTCRMPLGPHQGIPRADPGVRVTPPVLTSLNPLSTLLQRFACARLSRPCLPKSGPGVSATLTTTALSAAACGGLRSLLITEPEGPSFISRTVARRR